MHELILTIAFLVVGLILLIYAILWLLSAYLIVKSNMAMYAIKCVEENRKPHYWYVNALKWKYGKKYWRKHFNDIAERQGWTEEEKRERGWRK